jgi:hypothetical protein
VSHTSVLAAKGGGLLRANQGSFGRDDLGANDDAASGEAAGEGADPLAMEMRAGEGSAAHERASFVGGADDGASQADYLAQNQSVHAHKTAAQVRRERHMYTKPVWEA